MKVKIKNYQIIKEADLDFSRGVTVIVGSSNNGKSSIIRAIEAAINNKGGSSFINYDASFCEVIIEDSDRRIIWHKDRSPSKSFYMLGDKKLSKIGQKQVEEVGSTLSMSEILVNSEKFRLNFWKQLDFPFLVGRTHYQLFDFISKSKDQEAIANLQDSTALDIKNTSSEIIKLNASIDTRTKDIKALEDEIEALDKYNSFDIKLLERINSLSTILSDSIGAWKDTNSELARVEKNYFSKKKLRSDLAKACLVIDKKISDAKNLEELISTIKKERNTEGILDRVSAKKKLLKDKLKEINELKGSYDSILEAVDELSSTIEEIDNGKRLLSSIEHSIVKTREELKEFKVCPFCNQPIKNHEVNNG